MLGGPRRHVAWASSRSVSAFASELLRVPLASNSTSETDLSRMSGRKAVVRYAIACTTACKAAAVQAVVQSLAYRSTAFRPDILNKSVSLMLLEANGTRSNSLEKALTLVDDDQAT